MGLLKGCLDADAVVYDADGDAVRFLEELGADDASYWGVRVFEYVADQFADHVFDGFDLLWG